MFDSTCIPREIPRTCESYIYKNEESRWGNGQRNFALDMIDKGHVYFNDDDTALHPFLWRRVQELEDHDFIHFSQIEKGGALRLKGDVVSVGTIDSHNFIVSRECIGSTRWGNTRYDADGVFATECYHKSKSPIFIPKVLSIYNSLR